ncbi:MAG: glycosyltransferase family 2 protein [Exiguobacterium sp.]|nr:glycosyltransferase family 2 protein [Exiguobacterium sp.]
MKHNPFFSIIMPVYGVQQYIADSIADILTQTFSNFELVVVDDCSLDCSIAIVEDLSFNDNRITIVHHEQNLGLSKARNTGMRHATGEWILILDPDDRYDTDLLELVNNAIEEMPADLIMFGHIQEYYDPVNRHLFDNPIELEAGHYQSCSELARKALEFEQQTHLGYTWNKAYRAEIIHAAQLVFEDDVPLVEDVLFNIAYLKHCKSITTVSAKPYHYAKRLRNNLTNEFISNYFDLHKRRIKELRDFVDEQGALDEEARSILGALYARFILSSIEQNTNPKAHMTIGQQKEWLEKLFDDDLFIELVPHARAADSKILELCLQILNSHNIPALLAIGNAIHLVRYHGRTFYAKVKSGR